MLPLQKSYQQRLDYLHAHTTFTVFGAGSGGVKVIEYLQQHGKTIDLILDNAQNKHGTFIKGIEISLPTHETINRNPVIIASTWHYEIIKQLDELACKSYCDFSLTGLSKENMSDEVIKEIEWLHQRLADTASQDELTHIARYIDNETNKRGQSSYEQYHHPNIVLQENDTVIDGGAFDALSTIAMLPHFKCKLDIHAFEPEDKNILQCKRTLKNHDVDACIKLVPKGLWSTQTSLFFSSSEQIHGAGCNINEQGDIEVKVTNIDAYCAEHELIPQYIKMDIEGAEYEALLGAKHTIAAHMPYLAICLYHDFDDLWRLPRLIDNWVPSYDMYIGHHSNRWFETVLYCIPKDSGL